MNRTIPVQQSNGTFQVPINWQVGEPVVMTIYFLAGNRKIPLKALQNKHNHQKIGGLESRTT